METRDEKSNLGIGREGGREGGKVRTPCRPMA